MTQTTLGSRETISTASSREGWLAAMISGPWSRSVSSSLRSKRHEHKPLSRRRLPRPMSMATCSYSVHSGPFGGWRSLINQDARRRFTQDPGHRHTRGDVIPGTHQGAVHEACSVQVVVAQEGTDPVFGVALGHAHDGLHAREPATGRVGRAIRGGVGRVDAIEVVVLLAVA